MSNWKKHVYNLTTRKDISVNELYESEILGFEKMLDYWYGNHKKNDVLCIRY
jgi:hypothetical protein